MGDVACGSCNGTGRERCFSCRGQGYQQRWTGRGDLDMSPCAVCGATGRAPCGFCQGRGVVRVPGAGAGGPALGGRPAPRGDFDPNDLTGRWEGQSGSYELKRSGDRYGVTENGVGGQTGSGEAVRQGDTLHMVLDSLLVGRVAVRFRIDGSTLRGELNVMGMPLPLVLERTSGPKATAKATAEAPAKAPAKAEPMTLAPPDLAARFTNRLEAARAARDAGAPEEAQRLYGQALEVAMESPEPDDDIGALSELMLLAGHTELSDDTLERCFDCLDGVVCGGHGGDAVADVLSLLVQHSWGRIDPKMSRRLAEHGLTLLRGGLSPTEQALVGWAAGAVWVNLGEADLARQTLELVDRAAAPPEMQPQLGKLADAVAAAEGRT